MQTEGKFVSIQQNIHHILIGYMTVRELNSATFVDTLNPSLSETDQNQGYQRELDGRRVKKAAKYLADDTAFFPSITLNAREGVVVDQEGTIALQEGSLSIVDGQHRVRAAVMAAEQDRNKFNLPIPVLVLVEASKYQECKVFIDSNANQKGVPVALCRQIMTNIESVNGFSQLDVAGKRNRVLTQIFNNMKSDINSVWYGKLYSPNEGTPKRQQLRTQRNQNRNEKLTSLGIWFQTLDRVYGTLIKDGEFSGFAEEVQVSVLQGIVEDFWQLVLEHAHQDISDEPYRYSVMTSKGVRILHMALNDIIKALMIENELPDRDGMEQFVMDFDALVHDYEWLNTKEEKGRFTSFRSANVAYGEFVKDTTLAQALQ